MKNKYLVYIAFILILSSCNRPMYQLYKTTEYNNKNSDERISISYDFWENKGRMAFIIKNNTNEILTVHTDKCFFVINGMSNCHFTGEITSSGNTRMVGFSPFSESNVAYGNTSSTSIVQQKIINIAPNGSHAFNAYSLKEKPIYDLATPSKKFIPKREFSLESTPTKFTNFITYSFGNNEQNSIEHSYYVNEVSAYRDKEFMLPTGDWPENINAPKHCPYASPLAFFIYYNY